MCTTHTCTIAYETHMCVCVPYIWKYVYAFLCHGEYLVGRLYLFTLSIFIYIIPLIYLSLSLNVYTYITISMLHLCVCLLIYICLLLFCQCYRVVWSADKRLNSPNLRFKFDFLFFFFNCFTFIVYLVINFFYYLCIIQYCF